MKTSVEIREIGPREAAEMLECLHDYQRHQRPTHIKRLARAMTDGEFLLSWDAIAIVNKKVANGQHRLVAVVESKIPQKFIVLTVNGDEELMKVGDCGVGRSLNDVFWKDGKQLIYGKLVFAGAKYALAYNEDCLGVAGFPTPWTRQNLIDYVDQRVQKCTDLAHICQGLYHEWRFIKASVALGFLLICDDNGRSEKAIKFLESVYTNEKADASAKMLNKRFVKQLAMLSNLNSITQLAMIMRGFIASEKGTTPNLRFTTTLEDGVRKFQPFPRFD